jgi:hypothetical protein
LFWGIEERGARLEVSEFWGRREELASGTKSHALMLLIAGDGWSA